MLTNALITIFNRVPDPVERKFIYIPHVRPEVWFHAATKVMAEQGGLTSSPVYKVWIPFTRPDWVPPDTYLRQADPEESWTVQDKDLFIVGFWFGENVTGIEEIKKQFSGTVGVILNHSENFFGSSKHIRIEGGE